MLHLIQRDPLLRVLSKHLLHQLLALHGHILPNEVVQDHFLGGQDLPEKLGIAREVLARDGADEHEVEDEAEGPDVDSFIVLPIVIAHFRRQVQNRAIDAVHAPELPIERREAEV